MKDTYIMVFDIDGTLAPFQRPIARNISEGLCALENAGHTICLASGKSCAYVEGLMRGMGLSQVIAVGENGAIARAGYSKPALFTMERSALMDELENEIGRRFPKAHFQENLVNITAFSDDAQTLEEITAFLMERGCFDRDDMTVYVHQDAVEIVPCGVSKGNAISVLKQHYGWETTRMIAAGDGYNDECMKEHVGTFYVVGDAIEGDKQFADDDALIRFLLEQYTN